MKNLDRRPVFRSVFSLLCLSSLFTFAGCATLPRFEEMYQRLDVEKENIPEVIGPHGQLSPTVSKRVNKPGYLVSRHQKVSADRFDQGNLALENVRRPFLSFQPLHEKDVVESSQVHLEQRKRRSFSERAKEWPARLLQYWL